MSMVIFALSRQMPFVFKNFIDLAMGVCQKNVKLFHILFMINIKINFYIKRLG